MKHPTLSGLISLVQTRQTVWLITCTLIIALVSVGNIATGCDLFNVDVAKGVKDCQRKKVPGIFGDANNHYHNIPILTAVYCYNNGTGICKVLAGRFEFYMNSWKQEYLGPVKADDYHEINEYGYHTRVPVTYTINGTVLYNDRAINWSRYFTKGNTQRLKLLSSESVNWCRYASTNNWPYKSAILDHDGSTHIYFFNRQSCIYDPKRDKAMHYNTRFLHKSKLRIDLDYNPTIWAMERNSLPRGDVRLVKHKRQHFREFHWKLEKNLTKGPEYFVEMKPVPEELAMIDRDGPFIRWQFYKDVSTKLCVSDHYGMRKEGNNNSYLAPSRCGIDSVEIATYAESANKEILLYEVGLHSIPREPAGARNFYYVSTWWNSNWEAFAKDGFSFSATTIIPDNKAEDVFEVISLYSFYEGEPSDKYDEHYPKTFVSRYKTKYRRTFGLFPMWGNVTSIRGKKAIERKDLNYVDDIEYLPRCKTILVIFGPLYTEYPADKFDVDTETLIGSIYNLGANEMINAFFAKDDKLYFYHRLNFVAEHTYTCGKSADELVTADHGVTYHFRHGTDSLPIFGDQYSGVTNHQEEKLFQDLGIFKGNLGSPEAPDAAQFSYDLDRFSPISKALPWWIWLLILLGASLLIGMLVLGLYAYRRRLRRRRYLAQTQRSGWQNSTSGLSRITARSGGLTSNRVSPHMSQRASVSSGAPRSSSSSRRRASDTGGRSQSSRSSNKPSGMSSRSPSISMKNSSNSQSRSASASRKPSSSRPSGTASHGQSRPR